MPKHKGNHRRRRKGKATTHRLKQAAKSQSAAKHQPAPAPVSKAKPKPKEATVAHVRRRSRRRKKRRKGHPPIRRRGPIQAVDVIFKVSPFSEPMLPSGILPLQDVGFGLASPQGSVAMDFIRAWLPQGSGWALDLSGMRYVDLCLYVVSIGYKLISCGVEPPALHIEELAYVRHVQEDFLQWEVSRKFDLVLNLMAVSQRLLGDTDLQVMQKLRGLMGPRVRQYLVVPVGQDAVVGDHRVYGERLKALLTGYSCLYDKFWRRQAGGWEECSRKRAVALVPVEGDDAPRAMGGFVLQKRGT